VSTVYLTEPPIEYHRFIEETDLVVKEPKRNFYIMAHKFIMNPEQTTGIFAYDQDGHVRFERCGTGDVRKIFPNIIQQFRVTIRDEYGLEWPN
jgi:hypothetical protein